MPDPGTYPATAAGDKALVALDAKLEAVKKKIVATKEGGAITGEERIREHTDHLYGALLSWEGKPAAYLLDRPGYKFTLWRGWLETVQAPEMDAGFIALLAQAPPKSASPKGAPAEDLPAPIIPTRTIDLTP